ncbi:MAG: hypothetical protein QOJ17_2229, partial [Rhodospirillaceae bacterium]|nr:hypothetical protein [Rhodospirillaceae bacterium]
IARLLLHQHDPEEALRIVRGSEFTRFDPWLTGVEISLSDLVGRSPRFKRQAYDLVKYFEGDPAVISELAASIGTNEAFHGPLRRARQYFRLALKSPTENVVAQASGMSKKLPGAVNFDGNRLLNQESVYEARALSAYHEGRWNDVLAEAELWLADESFSSRPAVIASFVAGSMLGDFRQSERFANLGLIAKSSR